MNRGREDGGRTVLEQYGGAARACTVTHSLRVS